MATNTRSAVQRYKAEQELNTLAASLELQVQERTLDRNRLWQLSSDLMLVASFDGTITAINPAWTEVLGWAEEDLLGANLFELIHPEDLQHTEQGAQTIAAQKQHLNRFENRYRTKSGNYRWISWTAGPSDDFIIAVGRDATSEKEQVAALAKAEEALRQSQKMEAVGQLTGGLAHDFNNLLAGISGSLELLQRRLAQGRLNDVERYVGTAQSAARRAAALTHRLLAFSRQQTLDPKPTDAARLIVEMEELIRRTVGPQVELQLNLMPDLWNARVDASQLENSLLNLCINARDAMPDGGRIVIQASNKVIDNRMAASFDLPAGEYLCLCVSDTGLGMPPKVIARIFDPFFTTKPIGKGTGLGLSMIYGFAKQSGGQVRVHSTVNVGTAMYIYLPRHEGEALQPLEAARLSQAEIAGVGDTVLVVDDEPSIRTMVAEVLEELGYITLEAADGAGALTILESTARIDLLITDVGLPGGINGRQVADRARRARQDLKVLFITGYAEQAVIGDVQLEDGMQVLTKPFAMETMAERIKLLLAAP
ncbi:response regulator [Pseudomonas sp. KNUC1026]|uniref:response regulator n=1 Tax=Pseudomonas sp. KNUC1026 TaxID=2893890 RepID=UPI0022A75C0F|nr:response regulator [Pseudomonas sp. KNUC1026]